jgi:hypothetical protein
VKRFLLPIAASLLAYGLAYNTTIDVNTTGVSPDGVLLEVTAPASMNFIFDFTLPGSSSELNKANWAAFQNIVVTNTPRWLLASGATSYTFTVTSNATYQVVVGVPTASGTGFSLDRYRVTVGPLGATLRVRNLADITAPWVALTGNVGQANYVISVELYVTPSDVPSGFNQSIVIPLSVIPTP